VIWTNTLLMADPNRAESSLFALEKSMSLPPRSISTANPMGISSPKITWNDELQRVVKCFIGLLTPSVAPSGSIESTV
jgi:hypothetical protein